MSKTYLKIKIKSLSDEAKIIRFEEKREKTKGYQALCELRDFTAGVNDIDVPPEDLERRSNYHYNLFHGLKEHREGIVRSETRAALIAYGFLRGKAYAQIETNSSAGFHLMANVYDQTWSQNTLWDRVGRLIAKYATPEQLEKWGTQKKQGANKLLFKTLKNWVGGEAVNQR